MTNKTYFTNAKTAEDLKQLYKKFARDLHPDCNPGRDTTAEFQQMQAEYQKRWEQLKNIHTNAAGETYEKETSETADQYMDIIEALLHIPGLMIELCGSWLWITGNTKDAKDKLKELGFKYSANKQAWYYHDGEYRKFSKKKKSLQEIRLMYGSEKYATKTEEQERITA